MNGTMTVATRAMRVMPPRTTALTVTAIAMPMASLSQKSGMSTPAPDAVSAMASVSWLAFMMHRVPKSPATANVTASHFHLSPSPCVIMCMGPPAYLPSGVRVRYLIASTPSWYLVHMPTRALTHIQNTAPAPPMAIAIATPAMLPIPTVAATTEASAWAELMAPESFSLPARKAANAWGSRLSDTMPDDRNRMSPPPIRVKNRG